MMTSAHDAIFMDGSYLQLRGPMELVGQLLTQT